MPDPSIVLQASGLRRFLSHEGQAPIEVLRDVSFTLSRGQSMAILGASGSGKSTLLGLLAGLDRLSAGEIYLFGEALHAMDEDARAKLRARAVGFVFQSFQLLPHLTALENVLLPLELSGTSRASDASLRERAAELLARVGLQERLTHFPTTLSGGEQQRVALARAFVGEPPLIFADEPTGSLDARTGDSVADLMFGLAKEHGASLVLVTHDEPLSRRCDRRVVLRDGVLHEAN
jgi:putative ABC transport system ATP-binding protein